MDKVKCKFCGKVLTSISSINVGYGPECARKHYRRRSLLEAWEDSMRKENENRVNRLDEIASLISYIKTNITPDFKGEIVVPIKYTTLIKNTAIQPVIEGYTNIKIHIDER